MMAQPMTLLSSPASEASAELAGARHGDYDVGWQLRVVFEFLNMYGRRRRSMRIRLRAFGAWSLMIGAVSLACTSDVPAQDAPVVPPKSGESETIKLFNGRDLDGWMGHDKHWTVRDGTIVGKNNERVPVSTYLLTKRNFSDFRLLATVKLARSEMHSGIALWGRVAPEKDDPYTYAGHLVMFPSGWGLYDLYGRNGLPVDGAAAKKVGKQHDWNQLEILAQGNRIRLAVNGVEVVDWRDPEPDRIKEGPIGLQLHANNDPQEVQFKDLVLTTFPEDKLITVK
jgi:hypothetical protein